MEGILAALASNAMSEMHASNQYTREKNLMNVQNSMNNANALGAYQRQVQGMRMAGLNPAAAMNQAPQQVTTSKGSVGMAENVEISPESLLLDAQRENIQADTAKKRAETGNVEVDTGKKFAEKLFTEAGTEKVQAETTNINNINDTYADTNRSLAEFGRGMAEKWQASPWFNNLEPKTKDTIDAIATGEMPLTVGGIKALSDVIDAQKNLSDADRAVVRNAFDNAVTESMFSDKAVMDAISKEPKARYDLLNSQRDKILEELPKIRQEVQNLLSDLKTKKLTRAQMKATLDSFKAGNLDYLKSKGEYGKWFEKYAEEMLLRLMPMVTGGVAAKATFGSPKEQSKGMIEMPGDRGYNETMRDINRSGHTIVSPYSDGGHGVGSFRY